MKKSQFIHLIDKYLEGNATETEKQLVEECLKKLEQGEESPLDAEQEQDLKDGMWQKIQENTIQHPVPMVSMPWFKRTPFRLVAVAASVLLVVSLVMKLFTNQAPDKQPRVAQTETLTADSSTYFVRHEVNRTGKEKEIQLLDGSRVLLSNNSEITYHEPFGNKREITLVGKAYFKVAKDKERPFTVISGDISTTALGTEFTVTTFEKSDQIIVRLYEGSVVIKAVEQQNKNFRKDVYLKPGQAFVYGDNTVPEVKEIPLNSDVAPEKIMNEELTQDKPFVPENEQGSWYMFNNQSLPQVFSQLAEMYHVDIVYDKKDVQNIYFLGKYRPSDSVENILKEIAALNNLTITRDNNTFIVSKAN